MLQRQPTKEWKVGEYLKSTKPLKKNLAEEYGSGAIRLHTNNYCIRRKPFPLIAILPIKTTASVCINLIFNSHPALAWKFKFLFTPDRFSLTSSHRI